MENIALLVIILLILELFEAYLQHADTLYGVMEKLNFWYQKSIFAFFAVHPSFYFVLFVVVMTDILNIYMLLIFVFKIFDLFYKIELIKTIFIKQNIPADLSAMLDWKIPAWFFLFSAALYPPLLFYALM